MSNRNRRYTFVPKDEYLQHGGHKYIKKFMKNGKWVYQYAKDVTGISARSNLNQAKKNEQAARNTWTNTNAKLASGVSGNHSKEIMKAANSANALKFANAAADRRVAESKYNKTLLGKAEKGAKKVSKVLNKVRKKVKKAVKAK